MKTSIKKPQVEKFSKVQVNPLGEKAGILSIFDNIEDTICGALESMCDTPDSILCTIAESIMNALGCIKGECEVNAECMGDLLCDDGSCVECIDDNDCSEAQECDENECVLVEDMCYTVGDCGTPPSGHRYDCINNGCEECMENNELCDNDGDCCAGDVCSIKMILMKKDVHGNPISKVCCTQNGGYCDSNVDCCSLNCDDNECTFGGILI